MKRSVPCMCFSSAMSQSLRHIGLEIRANEHRSGRITKNMARLMALFVCVILLQTPTVGCLKYSKDSPDFREELQGKCVRYHEMGLWWQYEWCPYETIKQYRFQEVSSMHQAKDMVPPKSEFISLGTYDEQATMKSSSLVRNAMQVVEKYTLGHVCQNLQPVRARETTVILQCCAFRADETYIESMKEISPCEYEMRVCLPSTCPPSQMMDYTPSSSPSTTTRGLQEQVVEGKTGVNPKPTSSNTLLSSLKSKSESIKKKKKNMRMDEVEKSRLAFEVKQMFAHAFTNYMTHAFPHGNLKPITCDGDEFEHGKVPMLTLIDTLDTLAILGFYTEFRDSVELIKQNANFDLDIKVSVFEITIRVLGGLISGHLMAVDPAIKTKLYPSEVEPYNNELLDLAVDLADRLLPAFNTPTKIPYGTVNLRHGVPKKETTIASTAGAGTLSVEFAMLSILTNDPKYGRAGKEAMRSIFHYRSSLDLVGKHINTSTGDWTESTSGLGTNSDSFYEYLLKMYILYDDEEFWMMFNVLYTAVVEHNKHGDWYQDVSMWSGCPHVEYFENLMAFWPGMQTLFGDFDRASRTLNAYYAIWREFGFIPEQFDIANWSPGSRSRGKNSKRYPLRPELIESTYYMYQATKDSSWLQAGKDFLNTIQRHSRTKCGYASVLNIVTKTLDDTMPSFFLSETCKYLYLLFDESNFVHNSNSHYVFTTEAHLFPVMSHRNAVLKDHNNYNTTTRTATRSTSTTVRPRNNSKKPPLKQPGVDNDKWYELNMTQPVCRPVMFYHNVSYDMTYEHHYYRRSTRCDPVTLKKDAPVSTRVFYTRWGKAMKLGKPLVLNGGVNLGYYNAFQIQGGFLIQREDTWDWMRVTNLGFPELVAETRDTWRRYNTLSGKQWSCEVRVHSTLSVDSFAIPCATAGFGPLGGLPDTPLHTQYSTLVFADPAHGCSELKNAQHLKGKVVVVKRGTCMFVEKVERAQRAGALAVVVTNLYSEEFPYMMMAGSVDQPNRVHIPAVMVDPRLVSYVPSVRSSRSCASVCSQAAYISEILRGVCLESTMDTFLVSIHYDYAKILDENSDLIVRGSRKDAQVYSKAMEWGVLIQRQGTVTSSGEWGLAVFDLTKHQKYSVRELIKAFSTFK